MVAKEYYHVHLVDDLIFWVYDDNNNDVDGDDGHDDDYLMLVVDENNYNEIMRIIVMLIPNKTSFYKLGLRYCHILARYDW